MEHLNIFARGSRRSDHLLTHVIHFHSSLDVRGKIYGGGGGGGGGVLLSTSTVISLYTNILDVIYPELYAVRCLQNNQIKADNHTPSNGHLKITCANFIGSCKANIYTTHYQAWTGAAHIFGWCAIKCRVDYTYPMYYLSISRHPKNSYDHSRRCMEIRYTTLRVWYIP